MNKTAIRNFAVWARNKLINDVTYRAGLMGVTASGIADPLPQSTDNVQFFDIGMSEPYQITGEEIKQRKSLVEIIKRKEKDSDYTTAFTSVVEEVAYTWFNRLIAIRFMEVNDYLPSHVRVLSSESGKLEPDLVTTPYDAELFFANGEEQIIQNLKSENRLDEVFRVLFIKQCNELYSILPRLFENLSDYSELLLNVSFIDQDGVVYHLVHDIPEEDFNVELGGQVEIIGWLYQYYNAELKDETFALLKKNIKVTKERVPSATQLFTPDWIVRYMVENSLGRLWLAGHPNDDISSDWKYYLTEVEQDEQVTNNLNIIRKEYENLNPVEIKVIDPCMGSGHILVYAFDVLMQIYESAGWTQRDAAKSILENNIFGLDIDDRAAQLAYFAVMMKARQYNRRIFATEVNCHVVSIRESNGFEIEYLKRMGEDILPISLKFVSTFIDAKEYGSIIKLDINLNEICQIKERLNKIREKTSYNDLFEQYECREIVKTLAPLVDQAEILLKKYDVFFTNPPYMNGSGMSDKLNAYVKDNYFDEKADLYSCCMAKAIEMVKDNCFISMITMETWMFLGSLEKMRNKLLDVLTIGSLIHMPYLGKGGTSLGINFGTSAFVFHKSDIPEYKAEYNYIRYYELDDEMRPICFPLHNERHCWKPKNSFLLIPGKTISYWISSNMANLFTNEKIGKYAISDGQTKTGDNARYLRCLWEVSNDKIQRDSWALVAKGGEFRRWYGNIEYLIDWSEEARKHFRQDRVARIAPEYIWFRSGVSWNHVTSNERFAARLLREDMLFETAAPSVFFEDEKQLMFIIGYLNSRVSEKILKMINPTMCSNVGDITSQPYLPGTEEQFTTTTEIVEENISLSKADWDSYEVSDGFGKHPLI